MRYKAIEKLPIKFIRKVDKIGYLVRPDWVDAIRYKDKIKKCYWGEMGCTSKNRIIHLDFLLECQKQADQSSTLRKDIEESLDLLVIK